MWLVAIKNEPGTWFVCEFPVTLFLNFKQELKSS
jgi:hypothetical protein